VAASPVRGSRHRSRENKAARCEEKNATDSMGTPEKIWEQNRNKIQNYEENVIQKRPHILKSIGIVRNYLHNLSQNSQRSSYSWFSVDSGSLANPTNP